jgi:hypothetical protein
MTSPTQPPIVLLLGVHDSLVAPCHAAIRAVGARGIEVDRASAATAAAAARPHVVLVPALAYAAESARIDGIAHVGGAIVMAFHDEDAAQGGLSTLLDLVLGEALRRRKSGPAPSVTAPAEDAVATLALPSRAELEKLGVFEAPSDESRGAPGESAVVRRREGRRWGT